jgi:hypothetical protein
MKSPVTASLQRDEMQRGDKPGCLQAEITSDAPHGQETNEKNEGNVRFGNRKSPMSVTKAFRLRGNRLSTSPPELSNS